MTNVYKIMCSWKCQSQISRIAAKSAEDAIKYCLENYHGIEQAYLFKDLGEYVEPDVVLN
jgi:hypothetical protein